MSPPFSKHRDSAYIPFLYSYITSFFTSFPKNNPKIIILMEFWLTKPI